MGLLDSFKPRKLVAGSPFISITDNGVSLNKSAVDRLEYAEYVKILVDEDGKRLAIQICESDDADKTPFVNASKGKEAQYVRWNNREFIKQLLSWAPNDELMRNGFKVPGEYLQDDRAFLFIFAKAVPLKDSEDK